jgi:transposase-like protein
MHAYSTDLKERLVRAVADGLPLRGAARRFGVAVTTVKRAVVQQRATGSLARKPISRLPAPHMRVYPRETVVAEKFEAIVRLGLPNMCMKDFHDLWTLASQFASATLPAQSRCTPVGPGSASPVTRQSTRRTTSGRPLRPPARPARPR